MAVRCDIVSLRPRCYIIASMTDVTHQPLTFKLDRFAITLSGLCLVHCIATTVFVAMLASAGSVLGSPIIHEVGLTVAMTIGALALGKGDRKSVV